MKQPLIRLLVMLPLLFGVIALAACTESDEQEARDTARDAQQQAKDTAKDAKEQAKDAWADLRTEGERLVDRVQTRNDADAKKDLLDRCRDALERLRKNDSSFADQVDNLCNQIRDTDVNNSSAWNNIKSRLDQLNQQIGG